MAFSNVDIREVVSWGMLGDGRGRSVHCLGVLPRVVPCILRREFCSARAASLLSVAPAGFRTAPWAPVGRTCSVYILQPPLVPRCAKFLLTTDATCIAQADTSEFVKAHALNTTADACKGARCMTATARMLDVPIIMPGCITGGFIAKSITRLSSPQARLAAPRL